ncbi:MAG: L,D-transpeptidase family protein [Acidimicrobiia bacterium]|nr:L,D-transpeptidase family protein [Acidimicrobiia bacterium]
MVRTARTGAPALAALALLVTSCSTVASTASAAGADLDRAVEPSVPTDVSGVSGGGAAGTGTAGPSGEQREGSPVESSTVESSTVESSPRFLVATAASATVEVFAAPEDGGGRRAVRTLDNPLPSGAPLTFLVHEQRGDWLQVELPVRPNGSRGWVRSNDVAVAEHGFRVEVYLADHELVVYDGDEVLVHEPVALGRQPTPTPGGTFYLLELLQSDDPDGPYGPYAYGLSGFSEQLDSFGGGDGRLGLHGTNEPELLGGDASAGCIRVANETIEQIARLLPLGTPVTILP